MSFYEVIKLIKVGVIKLKKMEGIYNKFYYV